LHNTGNPTITKNDPYDISNTHVFDVDGDVVEIDTDVDTPTTLRWGKWRTNQDGDVF